MLKVRREQVIRTDIFELGDEIKFKLTTGEKVRAKAVQECEDGDKNGEADATARSKTFPGIAKAMAEQWG